MDATKYLPISFARDVYDRLRARYKGKLTITNTTLVLREKLINGSTNYKFQVNGQNLQRERPEIKLLQTDVFVGLEIGMFLTQEADARPGTGIRNTWPNPVTFGTNAARDMEAFYKAHLSVTVNNNVIAEPIYAENFLYVPELQSRALLTNTGPVNVESAIARDGRDQKSGYVELVPALVFNGKQENRIDLSVQPFASGTTPAWAGAGSGTEHYVEIVMRGLKIQGAADSAYAEIVEALGINA